MTFGSLFAGIGGLDLGLERAGMECLWQVEINDYATQVLERHWPGVRRHRDVRTFPPAGDWSVDLICGGFPCQDISNAGRRSGIEGSQSGLFFEVIRVARQLRPRFLLLENVSALLARGMGTVLRELAEIGYDAEWHCISSASMGAPHKRERVFIMAHSNIEGLQGRNSKGVPERTVERITGKGGSCTGELSDHWVTEPDVGRVADGVPRRVDRLKCLGNAVVPQVAEFIGRAIAKREYRRQ